MRYEEDSFDVVELGVASEETQGGNQVGPEAGGKIRLSGISDDD